MTDIKTLYITEKNSQLEDLAKVLGCKVTKKWHPAYNEESGIAIIPLKGHLYELLSYPHDYDEFYKKWEEKTILCFPDKFKKRPKKNVIDQVNRSLDHIKRAKEIIIASDFDNEGANLAMTVIEAAGGENKVSRMLEMGSTTEEALKRTLENPRDIPFRRMSDAGNARAYLDWATGMTLSRALTVHLGQGRVGLMYGGVKSPVIKFVVERDLAFESHAKIKYYTLSGKMKKDNKVFDVSIYKYIDGKKERKLETKGQAEELKKRLEELSEIKVKSSNKKNKKESPKQLYDLIEISSELAKEKNATSDESLEAAQALYDEYKIQSYPRTAIKFLKEEDFAMIPEYLNNLKTVMHSDIIEEILGKQLPKRKSVFNSAKVTSHGGLTPTEEKTLSQSYQKLRSLERAMFDKVSTRFIANFMEDYEFEANFGEIDLGDGYFASFTENIPKKAGWKKIYNKGINEEIENYNKILPDLNVNDSVEFETINITEGETKPKPRFKMDTLQLAMGNIANLYPDDKVLKEQLGESGIGTPATIPGILKELFATIDNKGEIKEPWLKMEGKNVVSTKRARDLVRVTPDEIMSPVKRALMFEDIRRIEQGEITLDEFLDKYKQQLIDDIAKIKELAKDPNNIVKKENTEEKLGKCPNCKDGEIYERPKAFICTNANWKQNEDQTWKNDGCNYSIFKASLQKFGKATITKTDVKNVLKKGEITVKLINSKTKEKYETQLEVCKDYGLKFKKREKKEYDSIGLCPFCKKNILNKDNIYSCSGAKWKKEGEEFINSGCTFQVRKNQLKNFGGKNISVSNMKQLLESGEAEFELVSKDGNKYKKAMIPDLKWGLAWKK